MFGVLVVETSDGKLGYVAAYSGLLAGKNNHDFFVPSVFDSTPPDGYFKLHEMEISSVNHEIESIVNSEEYRLIRRKEYESRLKATEEENAFRDKMNQAKAIRNAKRQASTYISEEENAEMIRESQFMKAEMKRLRKRNEAIITDILNERNRYESRITELKHKRKTMSDALQHWLFAQYNMLNAKGETRNLCEIFAETPQKIPPAGAGDCCAPKMLQYAFNNNLKPVCMAEFWYGASPKTEIRHHLHYYPACRGKCLPILTYMMQGLEVDIDPQSRSVSQPLEVVYEDRWLIVVCKPSGMLSVPGRSNRESVLSLIKERCPEAEGPIIVHRLDMSTSGLIVAAKTKDVHKDLQMQFKDRTVNKRYIALLDGVVKGDSHGIIDLPLLPDPLDRPLQKIDFEHGKTAITEYQILETTETSTLVALIPHTGRTHQLRVHCAAADGLGVPIKGDNLYGHPAERLYLHAETISFVHPALKKKMTFSKEINFISGH